MLQTKKGVGESAVQLVEAGRLWKKTGCFLGLKRGKVDLGGLPCLEDFQQNVKVAFF